MSDAFTGLHCDQGKHAYHGHQCSVVMALSSYRLYIIIDGSVGVNNCNL